MLKNILNFSNRGFVFLWLSICYFTSNNRSLALNVLQRSRLCFHIVKQLIENESLIGDVKIDDALHRLNHTPMLHLRIEFFQKTTIVSNMPDLQNQSFTS